MCVTGRGLYLHVVKKLADHRQALAESQRSARKTVAEIKKSYIL